MIDPLIEEANAVADILVRLATKLAEQQSGYPTGGQPTGGTTDRTGNLAVRNVERHDQTDTDYTDLRRILQRIDDIRRRAMPNNHASRHAATLVEDRPGCRSCHRVGAWNEIRTNGMCRWCNNTLGRCLTLAPTMTGDMPPASTVDAYRRGIRITDTMLKAAIHADPAWKPQKP